MSISPGQAIQTGEFVLDVIDLFKTAFGVTPFVVPGQPASSAPENKYQVGGFTAPVTTFLGTPLYGQDALTGRDIFLPISLVVKGVTYNFPYAVIGFKRSKRWVSTAMTQQDGEVNELISKNSYDITIKGFLIGVYGTFPDTQLDDLRSVFEVNEPVHLQCALTDIFLRENDTVIIQEYTLPEKSGTIGVRDFTMKLKTDSIFTLYID